MSKKCVCQKALGAKGLMRLEALQYKSLAVCIGVIRQVHVRSRWLDIGQVLFLRDGPRRSRGS